jgi:hypothetical protein
MIKYLSCVVAATVLAMTVNAQAARWQQKVKYTMNVDLDVNTNRMTGHQTLNYWNNSPDTLKKVYYHLYWNAFQPNSMMDARSQQLGKTVINGRQDWDARVKDRISKLKENEIGYQKILSLKMNGVPQVYRYHETILEVALSKPILPKTKVTFDMQFETQVPIQIRRSGRDNAEGVRYSMTQWYPKLAEYDQEGWHPNFYVAREFHGVWGDFDVTINIQKDYKLAGSGVLQNPAAIGWSYDKPGTPLKNITTSKRTWRFIANNVHDFAWAADPNYGHIVKKHGNITFHVVHKQVDSLQAKWEEAANALVMVTPFIEKNYGKYPYPQYSVIQGGDGGMEYPMATLVKGPSLGTVFHEFMHSWYQMILGTNESLNAWMDEGFASFADSEVSSYYEQLTTNAAPKSSTGTGPRANTDEPLPLKHAGAYANYFALVKTGREEPLTTHADHYNTNFAYSIASYSKGEIFLTQLGYIVGEQVRDRILLEYYNQWKFKHPTPVDFIRLCEDVSGVKLDWYRNYWVNTTKTIDYGIDSLWEENGESKIRLRRVGLMPMPIDVEVRFKDNTTETHYVPLNLMFGEKPSDDNNVRTTHQPWKWTHPTYVMSFKRRLTDVRHVEIDPTRRMADVERKNNVLELKW